MTWIPLASLLACLATGPLVRRMAIRLDLFDRPDGGLKPHQKPIPYLGGVAIWFGWLAGMLTAVLTGAVGSTPALAIAAAMTILMVLGLIDDIRHLPPKLRLLVQFVSPIVIVLAGVGVLAPKLLLADIALDSGHAQGWLGSVLATLLAACLFAGATNATNVIDGLDGLCAGVLGISAAGFAALFYLHGTAERSPLDSATIGLCVSLCVLAACAAFLCFNFNPASMFMGDSGSLLLGGSAGLLLLLATSIRSWQGLVVGLLIFGFPVYDMALAISRRRLNKKPLIIGDRSHFYDQLRDRGLSVRQTVLCCYALAAILAVAGNLVMLIPGPWFVIPAVLLPAIAVALSVQLGLLRVDDAANRSANGPPGGS
ncbi:MAG: undecaprenyl/decaprenyl-phosphate alpha-N-acetylglucosaminyl 1-phosphate transferase [Phycisphaerales bacterium]|nr:undecaprenyl/decaprenyl-phosphate alpha-N-acetylglucosaminyl 1-phosphate transferase [Phycisphaerales bacterium]